MFVPVFPRAILLVTEFAPPAIATCPVVSPEITPALAITKASVAILVVLSPAVWVAAAVPFGRVGVPLKFAAVPEVFAALFGMIAEFRRPLDSWGMLEPVFPIAILEVIVVALPATASCPEVIPESPGVELRTPPVAKTVVPSTLKTPYVEDVP
jgi:hypothetical protein